MSSRRRRRNRDKGFLSQYGLLIGGAVLVVLILTPVAMNVFGDDSPPDVIVEEVEEFPDQGRDHVAAGSQVEYDTDPPTSGPHYSTWADTGFHTQPVQDEFLVHNLEHGHIVIYYNPATLSDEASEKLTSLTDQYTGTWDAVMAVPWDETEYELVLTAWNHVLNIDEYDEEKVDAFEDHFRGRGPENPVR